MSRLESSRLPFRSVNRSGRPGYQPGMQRHHLLPRQLLSARCFGPLFAAIGRERVGFDDFRSNGLLLPASDCAAAWIGLPLHRGPHRDYSSMVTERVGQIEEAWSAQRLRAPEIALDQALMRLGLLQRALRKRLLSSKRRLKLSRKDPLGRGRDFSELDRMAESLWGATQVAAKPVT
ncbi:MAG TPA: AHH domain-containing protein [Sphingomonadaceae bacterium]|nr:AHH domain-containing protein [Sphingomonadaceae bacterium]